jgi:hypothetical protein
VYLNYLTDPKELGFKCINDIKSDEQLNQIIILVFSKKILVSVYIVLNYKLISKLMDIETNYQQYLF